MLMILLTVLSIAVSASLPAWSGVIRREKEEELIFRGLQYAEAIRVFQNRFQRPPIRLQELIEVEPRSIRKLWKDPMTEDGKWRLIPLQGPGGLQVQEPINPGDPEGQKPGPDGEEPEGREGPDEDDGGFGPKPKEEVQIGPFKGVHSKSNKTSFLLFTGRDRYDEWHFTVELLLDPASQGQGGGMAGPGGDPAAPRGGQLQMSARWIGRPIPESLLPRQGTGLPQDGDGFNDTNTPKGGGAGSRPGTGKP